MSVNRRQVIVKFIVKIRDFQYKHSMKLLAEVIDHFQNEKLMFHVFAIKKVHPSEPLYLELFFF